jgi:hypothetical protein
MSLINFRNGFFLTLGFSLGYMKAVHDNEELMEKLDALKNDPELRESIRELKDGFKEAIAKDEVEVVDEEAKASVQYPANGTDLDPHRKAEINLSTPENPVTISKTELDEMELSHVKVNIGRGRFLVGEDIRADLGLDPTPDEPTP